jgi:hypothetical protein
MRASPSRSLIRINSGIEQNRASQAGGQVCQIGQAPGINCASLRGNEQTDRLCSIPVIAGTTA